MFCSNHEAQKALEEEQMRRPRRNHTAAFKAKVAIATIKGDKTLAELAEQYDVHANVHANQIAQWKAQLLEKSAEAFMTGTERAATQGPSVKDLQAKIGQLTMENDFLEGALGRIHGPSAKR
jgi:transposase-like protein